MTFDSGMVSVGLGDTPISTAVAQTGSVISYRGYSIKDLAEHSTYEEVAYLLIYGKLPNSKELAAYQARLSKLRELPPEIRSILEHIPMSAHPIDVLRTGASMMGTLELEGEQGRSTAHVADRLIATMTSMLPYWYLFANRKHRIATQSEERSIAGHFLRLLKGRSPDETFTQALDTILVLYAEHEFDASTLTARAVASTLADSYSAVTAGISALHGPLQGGAIEAAMELIASFDIPLEAEKSILNMLQSHRLIMGFGNHTYKNGDPRSDIAKGLAEKLSEEKGNTVYFDISERIEQVMMREKGLYPNLDFYAATTYHLCGVPTFMFTPLSAISRTAGWGAHVIEQQRDNRLISPRADYTGPGARKYRHLADRS